MNIKEQFPVHFYLGLTLVIVSWYFNWNLQGIRTHYLFFPLWMGYSLLVDGIVYRRKGTSLLTVDWKRYILLYFISIPVWWLFEGLNVRTQNWLYLGLEHFTDMAYFLFASLSFSTVIPAVFGTAELVSSFDWVRKLMTGPRISSSNVSLTILLISGILGLILLLIWPGYFYVFLWISVFFILDSLNHFAGRRSLVFYTNRRDWRPLVSLALGCLICGFFWEMWNFLAYPKWMYRTPGVEFGYVFEMPMLGYLGYIPFSFELFAFYHLVYPERKVGDKGYYLFKDF